MPNSFGHLPLVYKAAKEVVLRLLAAFFLLFIFHFEVREQCYNSADYSRNTSY